MPLLNQRFREMFRQAQHDRKNVSFVHFIFCHSKRGVFLHPTVIPSVVEESRGNEFFLLPRGNVALLFSFSAARVK